MDSPRLSVVVITKDIAGFLPRVLANVESVADEIVIVDSLSTDGTQRIAAAHPKVRLVERAFSGSFGDQKNFAFSQARGDWILNLDQDELLGDELRAALPGLVRSPRHDWYKLPRYWLLSGPPWRYVDSEKHYPDLQLRLFRNLPRFRYAADQIVHHSFPRDARGRGRKLRDLHVFHFDYMLNERPARAAKVRRYAEIDPHSHGAHMLTLYEAFDFRCRRCREPLTDAGLEVLALPDVRR